ncbi:hypothetical protein [Buchananella hordeovulneris]|uniref:hypothetical protein n=1 Tax=Buchananella hordeovulneris TaxID=52770 RepID=UPI0026DC9146|nr:hypothetical protein [Buchananella hordeovulneris]
MSFGFLAAIAEVLRAIIDGVRGLAKLPRWFRERRAALPEEPFVDFTEEYWVDSDGVRWVKAWMQSASARAYVHDVCCEQCLPSPVPPEKFPKVAKASEFKSLPPEMRSLSKRKIRDEEFVFKPQYLAPNEPVEFWVSCPLWIEEIELAITMSVGRFGYKRRTDPFRRNVPGPYDPVQFELDYDFR